MSRTNLKSTIICSILIALMMAPFSQSLFAVIKPPTKRDIRLEEVDLKDRLEKPIREAIKKRFLALSVKVLYVEQKRPILSKGAQSRRFKLPGFDSKVTLSKKENGISGYVNVYERYRNITLLVNEPLSKSLESSLEDLLREESDFKIRNNDSFDVVIVAGALNKLTESPEKNKKGGNKEQKKLKTQQVQREKFSEMFPDLEGPPNNIDPRKEAESSKHLILSRTAFFSNDLNLALNEVIEAINVNPYSSKSYEMLGSIYYRLKWYQLALDNWSKALILDPNNKKLNKFISKAKTEL